MTSVGDLYLGCMGPNGTLAVATNEPSLARRKVEHTIALRWESGRFSPPFSVNWTACAIVSPEWPAVDFLYVGPRAELLLVDGKGQATETSLPEALKTRGQLIRNACVDGDRVWLVGSLGTLIEVSEDLTFRDCSVPESASKDSDLPHFECVCSDRAGTLYCGGYDGQLWSRRGEVWRREDSPTNLILTSMCTDGRGKVYAVGQTGTLVRGEQNQWERMPQVIQENLWSCVWFEGTVYASSFAQMFMLEGEELCTVELPDDPSTYGKLSERGDVLLSAGASDLLLLLPDRMIKVL